MESPTLEQVQAAVGDRYEVLELAGRGGMGAVFRGRHRSLGSAVAIKVLPVPPQSEDEGLQRFEREARLAANLPHPHIVPVFEFQVHGGLAFFVMPFVEGTSLSAHLAQRGRMELADVRQMLDEVGSALAFAHERGVIHRDVKPANILREAATGRWLIADFGVARPVTAGARGITATGMVVGTPAYMAPEQALGVEVDARADLYALAAVACEALTGAQTDTLRDAADNEVLLRAARPHLGRGISRALTAALSLDRQRRPRDVRAWLEAIDTADRRSLSTVAASAVSNGRGRWWAVVVLALAVGWAVWWRWGRATAADPGRVVVIAPATVAESVADRGFGEGLARAFEDQLQWIPDQRVIGADAVARALDRTPGAPMPPWDAVGALARDRFGATEVLAIDAATVGDDVRVDVQVHAAPGGRVVRSAEARGPPDSIRSLVFDLVRRLYAEEAARERAGWSHALPGGGMEAVLAFFDADSLFRGAAYEEAVRRYEDVIEHDSTFALAYLRRVVCEMLRVRPTQATDALRSALDAAARFKDRLDPTSAALLTAYEVLVRDGDPKRAHDLLRQVVDRRSSAKDAWFLLGYVEFYLGSLFGVPRSAARFAFERVHELSPEFAAATAQLALLAVIEDDRQSAQRYFGQYRAVDDVSVWAEVMRMVDSLLYRTPRAALAVRSSFDRRPAAALEVVAFGAVNLGLGAVERIVAQEAIEQLLARATTDRERAVAFRMQLASLTGGGRVLAADTAWRAGRRRNVPEDEMDRWLILGEITGTVQLGEPAERAAAAARLAARDDPEARWLAARWFAGREEHRSEEAAAGLRRLTRAHGPSPLAASLAADLIARGHLASGDTAAALAGWEDASGHYAIEAVPFGLLGSLWPLRLAWARVAAAHGDDAAVLAATAPFEEPAGFLDQVGWVEALRLRANALAATGDALGARAIRRKLVNLLVDADGPMRSLRDELVRDGG